MRSWRLQGFLLFNRITRCGRAPRPSPAPAAQPRVLPFLRPARASSPDVLGLCSVPVSVYALLPLTRAAALSTQHSAAFPAQFGAAGRLQLPQCSWANAAMPDRPALRRAPSQVAKFSLEAVLAANSELVDPEDASKGVINIRVCYFLSFYTTSVGGAARPG